MFNSEKKFQFAFEQLTATGASVTAPAGIAGVNIGAGVYVLDLKNFEYTFEKGGKVEQEVNKLYKRPEQPVSGNQDDQGGKKPQGKEKVVEKA